MSYVFYWFKSWKYKPALVTVTLTYSWSELSSASCGVDDCAFCRRRRSAVGAAGSLWVDATSASRCCCFTEPRGGLLHCSHFNAVCVASAQSLAQFTKRPVLLFPRISSTSPFVFLRPCLFSACSHERTDSSDDYRKMKRSYPFCHVSLLSGDLHISECYHVHL